jgi:hypothetical protein
VGGGVKIRLNYHVTVSADFRDYITGFPERLFSLPAGAKRSGMLHQFTPMVTVGYNF